MRGYQTVFRSGSLPAPSCGQDPSPALHSVIADAVIFAKKIMQTIDAEWPAK